MVASLTTKSCAGPQAEYPGLGIQDLAAPEAEEVQRGCCGRGHQSVLLLLLCSRLLALPRCAGARA